MIFTNLDPFNKPTTRHQIFVANAETASTSFDLQLINERTINPHFAVDFSAVGYITLYLGDLYGIWMDGGGEGSYASRDPETRTVVFDGSLRWNFKTLTCRRIRNSQWT